jgi:hypothetical protein
MKYTELPTNICELLIIELFQSIPQLLNEVAPNGFNNSFLVNVYHPNPEQQYKEYRHSQLRLIQIQRTMKKPVNVESTKSFKEFTTEFESTPVDEQYEIVSIFGDCIWNVFSNNHTVFNENFESYDFGSWRCSGGFIADVINKLQLVPEKPFGYMDFYMGNAFTEHRADLTPLYKFIFKKLKAKNLDWEFSFPQMGLVNFNHENEEPDDMKNFLKLTAGERALNKFVHHKAGKRLPQFLCSI